MRCESVYERSLSLLKEILSKLISKEGVTVYLFGSRAKGEFKKGSDIDIAIEGADRKAIILLREALEEANIPYKVDLLDLTEVSEDFKESILKEAKVLWKS